MLLIRSRLLVTILWVGSLWAAGYIVAPTLFLTLSDQVLAGTVAGSIFRTEAWVSVACGIVLLALERIDRAHSLGRRTLFLVSAMLVCTLIGYFGLQPFMAALRESAGPSGVMVSEVKIRFGILHGVSSGIYLVQSLLGAALALTVAKGGT